MRRVTVVEAFAPSVALPVNGGAASLVNAPFAGVLKPTSGGAVSTVHFASAGVGSISFAALTARTWKVWAPSASAVYVCGLEQAAQAPPSRLHWNVLPDCVDENVNVAVVLATAPLGPLLIVVSGGPAGVVVVGGGSGVVFGGVFGSSPIGP